MASRRLDAKIKQYMRDNPGVRYQKARDAVMSPPTPPASNFPTIAVPGPEDFFFASSREDTLAHCSEFRLKIGVAEDGTPVDVPLTAPVVIVGGTGSGKTVLVNGIVRQLHAAGFETLVLSEKMHGFPRIGGVAALDAYAPGTHTPAHMLIEDRIRTLRSLSGDSAQSYVQGLLPVAVVIDGLYTYAKSQKTVWETLLRDMQSGAEVRVHFIVASGNMSSKHTPRELDNLAGTWVLVGRPDHVTLGRAAKSLGVEHISILRELDSRTSRGRVHVVADGEMRETQTYWIPMYPVQPDRFVSEELADKANRLLAAFEAHTIL